MRETSPGRNTQRKFKETGHSLQWPVKTGPLKNEG